MRPTLDILLDHTCIFYHHRFLQALWGVGVGVGVGASYELLEEWATWCKCDRYVALSCEGIPCEAMPCKGGAL